jgi:hypothetical protein
MTGSVAEAIELQRNPEAASNQAGVDTVGLYQRINFTLYQKVVLPIDGFVFWVQANQLSPSAVFNKGIINGVTFNQPTSIAEGDEAATQCVPGSMHVEINTQQLEDETFDLNRIIFTSEQPIDAFNQINPTQMYLGEFEGLQFFFSRNSRWYQQAGLWHYQADAVYPDMASQIIAFPNQLNTNQQIVSNSLPIWLRFNNWQQPFMYFDNAVPIYPSFLSEENIKPPYMTVHIDPNQTESLATTAHLGHKLTHSQLARDVVKITMFGLGNDAALNFADLITEYSSTYPDLGILNTPIIRDEKRTQVELRAIAQKKTIEYHVSYNQVSARDIARQLILQAIPTFQIADFTLTPTGV